MPDPIRITDPGIYNSFPVDAYFADPCAAPSLTQSIAKVLIEQSPLHAWHAHPRLNPDHRHSDDTKFDIGNIAHKLLIGRGKDIIALEFDDWRTKAAQEARKVAASAGKLAVLGRHMARATRMVDAARAQLDLRGLGHLFRDGDGEVVLAWREDDLWLRQMIDWLTPDRRTVADYKTTDMSAAPHGLGRMMVNAGWDVQGAMAERGLKVLDPLGYRRRYFFIVQECEQPYCLSAVELSESALTMGRKKLAVGVDIWRRCVRENRWPGYPTEIIVPDYPAYAEAQWLDREMGEFAPPPAGDGKGIPPDHLMAG